MVGEWDLRVRDDLYVGRGHYNESGELVVGIVTETGLDILFGFRIIARRNELRRTQPSYHGGTDHTSFCAERLGVWVPCDLDSAWRWTVVSRDIITWGLDPEIEPTPQFVMTRRRP